MDRIKSGNIKIAILAGEPSGDDLGGAMMTAIRATWAKKYPRATIKFVGVGGRKMTAAGLASLFPMEKIARMGLVELLPHLGEIIYLIIKTIMFLRREKPDMLITIDIPDFSKRVAWALRKEPFPRIHLVAPTIWAWRPKRRFLYAKIFDALFCLYPFESRYFSDTKLKTFYMGHPLVAEVAAAKKTHTPQKNKPPQILLLAGSRVREVNHSLPLLSQFISQNKFLPTDTHYIFYTQPHLVSTIKKAIEKIRRADSQFVPNISVVSDYKKKWQYFLSTDLALCCMGTTTLEAALCGAPAVAFYRASPLTIFIVRKLIKIKNVCLPNLLAGQIIVPELIQEDATVVNLINHAAEQFHIGRAGMKKKYDKALKELRSIPNPATRAAQELIKYL